MKKRLTQADVHKRIALLEQATSELEDDLKQRIALKVEYYKPGNILKRVMGSFAAFPLQHKGVLAAAVTTGIGFLGKRILSSQVKKVKRRVARNLLQFGLRSLFSKGMGILANFSDRARYSTKK